MNTNYQRRYHRFERAGELDEGGEDRSSVLLGFSTRRHLSCTSHFPFESGRQYVTPQAARQLNNERYKVLHRRVLATSHCQKTVINLRKHEEDVLISNRKGRQNSFATRAFQGLGTSERFLVHLLVLVGV